MPLLPTPDYQRPFFYFNSHIETIWPSIFRKVEGVIYQRERLELADGDFLDLDWVKSHQKRLVIISHGLEGNSHRHYCKGMAHFFGQHGWDALAWNCRSCSGEMNRLPRFYHHGATEDIAAVIDHALEQAYETVALVGFSMGGSLTLKYLGERSDHADHRIKSAAVFSVPCDLGSSARELDKPSRAFYRNRFLKKLRKKIEHKAVLFPDVVSVKPFDTIRTFRDFDNAYTSPLHGFKDAQDFYTQASSGQYIHLIRRPTLIVNAQNDPFLPQECYPIETAKSSNEVFLEIPILGGHVGFSLPNRPENWMETRALSFCNSF